MRSGLLTTVSLALLLCAGSVLAQQPTYSKTWTTSFNRVYPLMEGGTLSVDNAVGRIWVEGADVDRVRVDGKIVVTGISDAAVTEGRRSLKVDIVGNRARRSMRLIGWEPHQKQGWLPRVDLRIQVPRNVSLGVVSLYGDLVSVSGVKGEVSVRTYKGDVVIRAPHAGASVNTINGDIRCELDRAPTAALRLTTVNGSVTLRSLHDAKFVWIAETLNGAVRASPGVRGAFDPQRPTMFRATIGAADGAKLPQILTASSTGDLSLSTSGESVLRVRSVPSSVGDEELGRVYETVSNSLIVRPNAREFAVRRKSSSGNVNFETRIGNIFLGEHRGTARLKTGAGEIVAGRILGDLKATTLGGPINVGHIAGTMDLDTGAGDINVVGAPRGGTARTGGGSIRLRSIAGPVTLSSGGGDIRVERALADVNAFTRSGDIEVRFGSQGRFKTTRLESREGNVVVEIPAGFGVVIDVTLLVDDETANVLVSQFEGLSVVRDRFEGRGRVRAVGAVNGGGPKIEIVATNGQVHLLKQ